MARIVRKRRLLFSGLVGFSVAIAGVIALAVSASALDSPVRSGASPANTSLSTLSNAGVSITPSNDQTIDRMRERGLNVSSSVRLLARRGDRAFLTVRTADGRDCFSVGWTQEAAPPSLGAVFCPASVFPSKEMPVIDLSVVRGSIGSNAVYLVRGEGFAADGVVRVALTAMDGDIVAETTVTDNVYSFESPPSRPIHELIAFDRAGIALQTMPYMRTER